MPIQPRINELLEKAAAAFADGRDPFSDGWLSENAVTLHQCYDLSDAISQIILGFLAAPEYVKNVIRLCAAAKGTSLSPDVIASAAFTKHVGDKLTKEG